MTARVIRDVREAHAAIAVGTKMSLTGNTTLAEMARNQSLDTIASEASEAAIGLAQASRNLETDFPDLGNALLLQCYGGLTAAEVAVQTNQPLTKVKSQLTNAAAWVLGQTVAA